MLASQIRQKAREALAGKWGKAALLTLSYVVLLFLIEWVAGLISGIAPFLSFLVSIALLVINVPISFGFIAIFMKLKRGEEVGYADFLSIAFSNIGNAWKVAGAVLLKLLPLILALILCIFLISIGVVGGITYLWSAMTGASGTILTLGFLGILGLIGYVAVIIAFIPKTLSYSLCYFILFDHPEMSGKEIAAKSANFMQGNKWRLFCLSISFIGWIFLSIFTLGIGYFWLIPYIMMATICFYEHLSETNVVENAPTTEDNNNNPIQGE